MKKIFCVSILFLILISAPALASIASNFQKTEVAVATWYIGQWDKLAFDMKIPANNGKTDILNAFTVKNLGTATPGHGLRELRLWVDAGTPGFQGWGVDKDLGVGIFYNNSWYWSDLIQTIPASGLRFFVSAEMWPTPPVSSINYTVQLVLPQLIDNNGDGLFDVGDQGVFVVSGNNGPIDVQITNSASQTISYGNIDKEGPKVILTNLFDNQVLTDSTFLIRGQARDQGNSSSEYVRIRMTKEGGAQGEWKDAELLTSNFSTWQYNWANITNGVYTIELLARDFLGHVSYSPAVTVSANVSSELSVAKSTVTISKNTVSADGSDTVSVSVKLVDNFNQPMVGELVYLNEVTGGKNTVVSSKLSAEDGQAVFSLSSTQAETKMYQVVAKEVNVGQQFEIEYTKSAAGINYLDGQWIKIVGNSAVYFLDKNNVRHAYPVQAVWESYFGKDFSKVKIISTDALAEYNLGVNVPFKTGTLMKIPSVPKVYKVEDNRVIRWITSEAVAKSLYGSDWAKLVKSIPESFFTDYTVGENIN